MSRTERAELTVLCMIYDGARILLQDRVDTLFRVGMWNRESLS